MNRRRFLKASGAAFAAAKLDSAAITDAASSADSSRAQNLPSAEGITSVSRPTAVATVSGDTRKSGGLWTLDLSGYEWQMEGFRPGEGEKAGLGTLTEGAYNWNGAAVPGDIYTNLWRAGEISDPHYGRDGERAKWAMDKEWWYKRRFKVPNSEQGRVVRLVFEGVDYSCDVWLNGKYLGHHDGMFSPFEYTVSSELIYGTPFRRYNEVVVRLNPPPRNYREVAGRKFDWEGDYWRQLTPMGIWRPVRLVATGPVQIEDVFPTNKINNDGSASIVFHVTLANPNLVKGARVRAVVHGANFESGSYSTELTVPHLESHSVVDVSLRIPDAKLWWPWDQGRPNLYEVETFVYDGSGKLSDRVETRFGIREIQVEYNPGYTKEEVKHPWTLVINGKREFLRSANWGGPPDIFYGRNSFEKYRKLIELARQANINNLRIFGWHPTEIDVFYQLCDELGITVWQDLIPLASTSLPEDRTFRDNTYAEAVAVIKKLRAHPSLVRLEGGEEMFFTNETRLQAEYTAKFLDGLEQAIRPYTTLPYVPTSPLNSPPILRELGLGGPKESAHYNAVFYTLGAILIEDYVKTWDCAVVPEFAITSAPNVESIRKFIPPSELWPPGPSWGYHWADFDVLRNLNYQIFGDERTGSLEDFVAATQISQGTIFQFGIEYMRHRKPKSSAISICHFITFSPDFKWGIVDYFQLPKRSFEFVKRAYQPLLASLQIDQRRWLPGTKFTGKLWIVNDFARAFTNCTLQVEITGAKGNLYLKHERAIKTITTDSSIPIADLEWKVAGHPGQFFRVALSLYGSDGQKFSANHYDLLVGDEEQARRECANRAAKLRSVKGEFSPADYYRFFPDLLNPDRIGDQPPSIASVGPRAIPPPRTLAK